MIYGGAPKLGTSNLFSLLPFPLFLSLSLHPSWSVCAAKLLLTLTPSTGCLFYLLLLDLALRFPLHFATSVSSSSPSNNPRLACRFFSSGTASPREFRLFWQPPPHLSHPASPNDELTKAAQRNPISPIMRETSVGVHKLLGDPDNRRRIGATDTNALRH